MWDLVSYNEKHNEANGEDNNDGESHNRSWNHGVEGPTDDQHVNAMRARDQRNLLVTLLLSQGVPMLLHGDELGRTQQGNNNGYAQDSELSWVHWDKADRTLFDFTSSLVSLRRQHPTFRRKGFFTGQAVRTGERLDDIIWLHPDGRPMEDDDWESGSKALGMYLNGHGISGRDERGQPIVDDHFLLFFNVGDRVELALPPAEFSAAWNVIVNTGGVVDEDQMLPAGSRFVVEERSTVVLREHHDVDEPDVDRSVASSLAPAEGPA
jgi:glycogen operon protein